MYGEVRGIIGSSVASIPSLELDPDFDEDDENAPTTVQGERDANQGYDSSHLARHNAVVIQYLPDF